MASNAQAWEQSKTCGSSLNPCQDGQLALPTAWERPCIAFHLDERGSQSLRFADIEASVRAAIRAWNQPQLSSLRAHFSGLTNESRVGYNPHNNRNANIITFRDNDWAESRSIMALTTVVHQVTTGKIVDADIEVNSMYYRFGVIQSESEPINDLQNTLTHELGHAFGFDHSTEVDATMFAYAATGTIYMRDLHKDDLEGLASVYPPSSTLVCSFKDYYFEAPKEGMNESPDSVACQLQSLQKKAAPPTWLLFCLALGCVLAVRSRRRSGTRDFGPPLRRWRLSKARTLQAVPHSGPEIAGE